MTTTNHNVMKTKFDKTDRAVLVYQAGIANVFRVTRTSTDRIMQSDFTTCENYVRGLRDAGVNLTVAWCNMAGDIAGQPWNYDDFDRAPFSEKFPLDIVPEQFA
jgi:hypothetical protein